MIPYFLNTNYTPKCLDRIKEELNNPKWYISPYDVERSDLSKDLRAHLQSLLPFKISDIGFLKRRTNTIYHPHIDPKRTFALNMLLTEATSDNEGTYVVDAPAQNDNGVLQFWYATHRKVEYTLNCFTLLNVKKIHYVVNNSDSDRIILSIGCNESSYEEFVKTVMTDIQNI